MLALHSRKIEITETVSVLIPGFPVSLSLPRRGWVFHTTIANTHFPWNNAPGERRKRKKKRSKLLLLLHNKLERLLFVSESCSERHSNAMAESSFRTPKNSSDRGRKRSGNHNQNSFLLSTRLPNSVGIYLMTGSNSKFCLMLYKIKMKVAKTS